MKTFKAYVKETVLDFLQKHYNIEPSKTTIRFYVDTTKNQTRVKLLLFIAKDATEFTLEYILPKINTLFTNLQFEPIKTSVPLKKVENVGLVPIENHVELQTLFYFDCVGRADEDVRKRIYSIFSKSLKSSGMTIVPSRGGSTPIKQQTIIVDKVSSSTSDIRVFKVSLSFPDEIYGINSLPCSAKLLRTLQNSFPNELVECSTNFTVSKGKAFLELGLRSPKRIFVY